MKHCIVLVLVVALTIATSVVNAISMPMPGCHHWKGVAEDEGLDEFPLDDPDQDPVELMSFRERKKRKIPDWDPRSYTKPPIKAKPMTPEEMTQRYSGPHQKSRPTKRDGIYF